MSSAVVDWAIGIVLCIGLLAGIVGCVWPVRDEDEHE